MKIIIDDIPLDCHKGYTKLTVAQKDSICNGCGPSGWRANFVPNTFYGLSIKELCNIHDYDFSVYKTIKGFNIANDRLYNNFITYINAKSNWFMAILRRRRAKTYCMFVESQLGVDAFYDSTKV